MHFNYKIENQGIVGFAAENTQIGQTSVKVMTRASLTSDDPSFYKLIDEVYRIFMAKTGLASNYIYRFLIILHKNDEVDIYINDFLENQLVKINRSIKKGEKVFLKDVDDITGVGFPDRDILKDDVIIYCTKIAWKFGLYFDFDRAIDIQELQKDLGKLNKELVFQDPSKQITLQSKDNKNIKINSNIKVIVEGIIDKEYILLAKKYLGYDTLLFEIEAIQDSNSSGGQSKLKEHFHRLVKTKHEGYKTLFVFDCDATESYKTCENIKTEFVVPFIWSENKSNTIREAQGGVENLFGEKVFKYKNGKIIKRLFNSYETKKNGRVIEKKWSWKKINSLNILETEIARTISQALSLFSEKLKNC